MITSTDNVITRQDIENRIEELESIRTDLQDTYDEAVEAAGDRADTDRNADMNEAEEALTDFDNSDDAEELIALKELLDDIGGCDELINDSYFLDYIKDIIDECYGINTSGDWPYRHMAMDYDAAAEEAKQDYISVEYDGQTFWAR
jgi:hypothetical protein